MAHEPGVSGIGNGPHYYKFHNFKLTKAEPTILGYDKDGNPILGFETHSMDFGNERIKLREYDELRLLPVPRHKISKEMYESLKCMKMS